MKKGSASVDLVDVDGHTALHWAALGGNAEVCQILMENGISPNVQVLMRTLKTYTYTSGTKHFCFFKSLFDAHHSHVHILNKYIQVVFLVFHP